MSVLSYDRFADLDVSSDEDDCHPNIEINTWRRLKARMREEKGIVKREPILLDKYNTTQVNTKKQKYDITGQGNDDVEREDDDNNNNNKDDNTNNTDSNNNDNNQDNSNNDNTDANTNANANANAKSNDNTNAAEQKSDATNEDNNGNESKEPSPTEPKQAKAQVQGPVQEPQKESRSKPETNKNVNDKERNLFEARSDPKVYLDEYLPKIKKFAKMKNNDKADAFLLKNYDLVHEATEGYIITFAVDRAVEGATQKQLQKYSRRCLTIHNLIQSCQSANVSPKVGVNLFFSKMENKQMKQMYLAELEKQVMELMGRIEIRRKERIKEAELAAAQEDGVEYVEEKAPLGPGGLDPTEVLNSLPEKMQQAFVNRDIGQLKQVLAELPLEDAQKYMKMCVDSGLWVDNAEDEAPPADENDNADDANADVNDAQAPTNDDGN